MASNAMAQGAMATMLTNYTSGLSTVKVILNTTPGVPNPLTMHLSGITQPSADWYSAQTITLSSAYMDLSGNLYVNGGQAEFNYGSTSTAAPTTIYGYGVEAGSTPALITQYAFATPIVMQQNYDAVICNPVIELPLIQQQ